MSKNGAPFREPIGRKGEHVKCDHTPGPRDGFPCAHPACSRGVSSREVIVNGVRYRRRSGVAVSDCYGQTEIVKTFEWFPIETIDTG